jgi:glycosyltransferase involved in cell wall biosynthesis
MLKEQDHNQKLSRPDISLSVFFPAYNEEENIGETVSQTNEVVKKITNKYEIIVVDDGSKDKTASIVEEIQKTNPHVKLIRHNPNRGYGAALWSGIQAAQYDWVFFTDADLQFKIEEINRLIDNIPNHDVVVGFRAPRKDPFMRLVNAKGWNILNRLLFGLKVRDIDCAFKIFRRDLVANLPIKSGGAMMSAEMLIRLERRGVNIKEVPVTHLPRTKGSPTGAKPSVIIRAFQEMMRLFRGDLGKAHDTAFVQAIKFGGVGILNTLVDIGIYYALTRYTPLFATQLLLAKFVSFMCGTVCSFVLNRQFTFKVTDAFRVKELAKFYSTAGVGVVLNVSMLYVFHNLLHFNDLIAVLFATLTVFAWSFLASKFWVFNKGQIAAGDLPVGKIRPEKIQTKLEHKTA